MSITRSLLSKDRSLGRAQVLCEEDVADGRHGGKEGGHGRPELCEAGSELRSPSPHHPGLWHCRPPDPAAREALTPAARQWDPRQTEPECPSRPDRTRTHTHCSASACFCRKATAAGALQVTYLWVKCTNLWMKGARWREDFL